MKGLMTLKGYILNKSVGERYGIAPPGAGEIVSSFDYVNSGGGTREIPRDVGKCIGTTITASSPAIGAGA